MTFPFVIFLACSLAGIGALALIGSPKSGDAERPASQRSIWAITLSTPALLVPTLLAAVVTWACVGASGWHDTRISENPFGLWRRSGLENNIALLVVMSVLVAGYVGLLTAWYRFGKADGGHFWQGIKSHTITFLLAKLAICGWASFVSTSIHSRQPITALFYVPPSLLLAPLLGTAAHYPGQPLRAIRAALHRSWDLAYTSRLILFQTLVMMTVWIGYWGTTRRYFQPINGLRSVTDLAQETSVLSFNPLPMLGLTETRYHAPFAAVACTAILMFFSTGFMHAHFRNVLRRPRRS